MFAVTLIQFLVFIVKSVVFTVQELIVKRKIHSCLPSFKAEFTASVPLTRIRDIAHRNDIPHDLKVKLCKQLLVFIFIGMVDVLTL